MTPNERFKAVREHYGLSMGAFGKKIGLGTSGVSAIEYSTRVVSEKHIKLICAAFPEISENWLRTGEEPMLLPPQDDQALVDQWMREYNGSPVFRALMTTYLQLSEPRRRLLGELIEEFAFAVLKARAEGEPEPDVGEYLTARVIDAHSGEKAQ